MYSSVPLLTLRRRFRFSHMVSPRRRYFDDEDEHQHSQLEYIPAPDSPSNKKSDCDSDSSEDPLDAFMEDLEKEVRLNC